MSSIHRDSDNSSSNSSHDGLQCVPTFLPIFTALFLCSLFLLPLFIFVLYIGYQRWRRQRSVARSHVTSHSDVFTFNMAALELISVLGSCVYGYGAYSNRSLLMIVGTYSYMIIIPGQNCFHALTCVEHYLAVVHPLTYRGLKQAGGVRIRNILVGGVWLFEFGSLSVLSFPSLQSIFYIISLLISSVVICFCSLSVLCVLIRPGPGEVGGNRARVDQSKRRAFQTIMAISGALLLRFLSTVVSTVSVTLTSLCDRLVLAWSLAWLSGPSSLVLPLLFLHRAGKLKGCKHNPVSG